jgi:hypothetical protein
VQPRLEVPGPSGLLPCPSLLYLLYSSIRSKIPIQIVAGESS